MNVTMAGKKRGDVGLKPEISKAVNQGPNPATALFLVWFFLFVLLIYVWGQLCVYVPV